MIPKVIEPDTSQRPQGFQPAKECKRRVTLASQVRVASSRQPSRYPASQATRQAKDRRRKPRVCAATKPATASHAAADPTPATQAFSQPPSQPGSSRPVFLPATPGSRPGASPSNDASRQPASRRPATLPAPPNSASQMPARPERGRTASLSLTASPAPAIPHRPARAPAKSLPAAARSLDPASPRASRGSQYHSIATAQRKLCKRPTRFHSMKSAPRAPGRGVATPQRVECLTGCRPRRAAL